MISRLWRSNKVTQDWQTPFESPGHDKPNVRVDPDGTLAHLAETVPSHRIARQITSGRAFFARYDFSSAAGGQVAFPRLGQAVRDLAGRTPDLDTRAPEPDVSIIIPIYGQVHFLLNCLDSLAAHKSRYSAEVLVIDDASPPQMQTEQLAAVPWIRYVRLDRNGGFLRTCNAAADVARGKTLVFLNNDTRVADGWLDELIGSFALFPKAGLVGSKLWNEDGSLQEAGGIFWREGNAWNYGRDANGDHPKYGFARRVDYCSGAAIAVPKDIWHKMGGFDALYEPAYCEDADIAFRLREAGYEVWLQPVSGVLHYEGRTHGKDLSSGGKAYQVTNMKRFSERWKVVLRGHRHDAQEPDKEANRPVAKRLLVLDAETPMPDRDCGSVIATCVLHAMQSLGYEITFAPQHNFLYDGRYTEDLQRRGVECLYGPFFGKIEDILAFRDDFDAVLVYRHGVVGAVYDALREKLPTAPIIFSNVDLHYLREEREAQVLGSQRARNAALITKAAELEMMCRVDCNIVHTEDETRIIREQIQLENIVELPYAAVPDPSTTAFEDRHDIMFLGGFRHRPNVDAMMHFCKTVWPRLLTTLPPKARLLIVGSSPPADIQGLASDRIVVTGFVDELKPWFESSRVFIAPLRYGAGIKGKVIESLRFGAPSVVTPIAAEGIGLTSGRDSLIGEVDDGFADLVQSLYTDPDLWHRIQTAGYDLVRSRFSLAQFTDVCVKVLDVSSKTWTERRERNLKRRLETIRAE